MSGLTIIDRTADARRENLERSRNAINKLAAEKEKKQYDTYISNINTLNQMKKIYTDFYPRVKPDTAELDLNQSGFDPENEGEDDPNANNAPQAAAKRSSLAANKGRLVRCIVNYEM
jgi:hypothetical protein